MTTDMVVENTKTKIYRNVLFLTNDDAEFYLDLIATHGEDYAIRKIIDLVMPYNVVFSVPYEVDLTIYTAIYKLGLYILAYNYDYNYVSLSKEVK